MSEDNLLKETLHMINVCDKKESDVSWVGSRDGVYVISWTEFKVIADLEYDSGFGGQEIVDDLVVVFEDNSWLERHEYDGSEGWGFKESPTKNKDTKKFTKLTGHSWSTIERNEEEE